MVSLRNVPSWMEHWSLALGRLSYSSLCDSKQMKLYLTHSLRLGSKSCMIIRQKSWYIKTVWSGIRFNRTFLPAGINEQVTDMVGDRLERLLLGWQGTKRLMMIVMHINASSLTAGPSYPHIAPQRPREGGRSVVCIVLYIPLLLAMVRVKVFPHSTHSKHFSNIL